MRAVTFVEYVFKRSHLQVFLQPAMGGLVLGGLALVTPSVLFPATALCPRFLPTRTAVWLALSGRAFEIDRLIGFDRLRFSRRIVLRFALYGRDDRQDFCSRRSPARAGIVPDASVYATVGMTALAVAIVGGPLTMSFLALETTGDFQVVIMVLIASTIVSVIVRQTFGYSFATWRLHLRGESIRSAQDVGWMRTLTVARMMKTDVKTISCHQTIGEFMEEFLLGSTTWVVAADQAGRYAGLVSVTDAHLSVSNGEDPGASIETLLRYRDDVLLPAMNIKHAADLLERSESDALAVLDDPLHRHVVGMLTEAHVLRRYTEELEKARRELAGEKWLGEA